MIPSLEIRQIARIKGVPLSTIERDYAQNWLLSELSTYPLVLKGGTGIKKVYFGDYRFSDDIDFTATKDINKKLLNEWFDKATKNVQKKSGIYFKCENTNINEDTTGFEVNTYFQITDVRDPIQRGKQFKIPCVYNWDTKEVLRTDEIDGNKPNNEEILSNEKEE